MSKGKFIVLEGIDGSGTTTQAAKLAQYFAQKEGYHLFLTKEPTGFETGKEIKRRLKEDKAAGINPFQEKGEEYLKLYVKDRKFHVQELILPCLNQGVHVVSDRYKYSTFAYQGAQGQDLNKIISMHEGLLVPDLVLLLDLPAETALERRKKDKTIPELFEQLNFQKKVRENYLALPYILPQENILMVDASLNLEEVHKQILAHVERLFQ